MLVRRGCSYVLYKPFRVDQLIDCLQSAPPPPQMAKPVDIPEPVKA